MVAAISGRVIKYS